MNIVQMANDLVLGLERLGDFFKGYDALVNFGKFIFKGDLSSNLDAWGGQLSSAFLSSGSSK
ncbi:MULTISPECIES: hypothetical protein [Corynebacterium]|uniref:Cell wall channel n=1 Tax=Corynebacterium ramonii TaxID=3026968 RepID=A0ABN4EIF0_9CORY|nr:MULTISPECIES: hypothetical protein [Corynebacterium]AIU33446.1 Hypothetical protein CulFRC11_1897 [Corynebacterium ramonii FRC0011]ESU57246.1 cell wall channel [Corynebacterium ulcerans NCTC 12077]STC82048.1 Cell wall channel [Corynebacterium ulcerans]